MAFGWYQELLRECGVETLAEAEAKLVEMLDRGGMIVHIYRQVDRENPELVGRHRRLRSFVAAAQTQGLAQDELPHEVERFLLDPAALDGWAQAIKTGRLLDGRWSVVELSPPSAQQTPPATSFTVYGKATLIGPPGGCCSSAASLADRLDRIK